MPVPPSSLQAIMGATIFANLSASNEVIGKAATGPAAGASQSGRCIGGYVYAVAAATANRRPTSSSAATAWSPRTACCSPKRAGSQTVRQFAVTSTDHLDVDVDRLQTNTIHELRPMRPIWVWASTGAVDFDLRRCPARNDSRRGSASVRAVGHPSCADRCGDIFQTQVAGLAKRLSHIGTPPVRSVFPADSIRPWRLLVLCKTLRRCWLSPRDRVHGADDARLRHHRPHEEERHSI